MEKTSKSYRNIKTFGSISAESLSITDQFTLPLEDGEAGQVLVTDGAGTVSWLGLGSLSINTDGVPEGSTNLYYTPERIDDRVSALIKNGLGLNWTYNDAANTLTGNVTLAPFSTSNLSEGSNLYYTRERVDDRVSNLIKNGTGISWVYVDNGSGPGTLTPTVSLSPFSTTNLSEGVNLYFTNERAQDATASLIKNGIGISWVYNDIANTLTPTVTLSPFTTDNLSEGTTNLYFTGERVDDRVAALVQDTATVTWTYSDNGNAPGVLEATAVASISIQDGGSLIGSRSIINFIEGSGVSFNISDDSVNSRVNITISSTGGGGSGTGTLNAVASSGVLVGDPDIEILNFLNKFSITESPNKQINVDIDMIIDDLSDVMLNAPVSDGDALVYDSGTGMWTNSQLVGVQGDQGAAGTQGLTGAQGAAGAQGDQGNQGAQGGIGSQGAQGAQSNPGAQGNQGAQGLQGPAGSGDGTQGAQGAQGADGAQGNQGADGAQGSQGLQGPAGSGDGTQGAQGAQGADGAQGDQGATGAQGNQGNIGNQGVQGLQGADGAQGAQGNQGDQGATGAQGNQGEQGADGTFQYWEEDQSTTSPNNLTYTSRFRPVAATSNADAIIQAKGTGAFLAQLPDGASTGGNKRGIYSIDFQRIRNNANQVASGSASVIINGERNRASGGVSFIGNGYTNLAAGSHSVVDNGLFCQANGDYSRAGGYTAIANKQYQRSFGVYSIWPSSVVGDNQIEEYILQGYTTNDTPTILTADGVAPDSTNTIAIESGAAYVFDVMVVGIDTSTGDIITEHRSGYAKNISGTTSGFTQAILFNSELSTAGISYNFNDTDDRFDIVITGEVATIIKWGARVTMRKVK